MILSPPRGLAALLAGVSAVPSGAFLAALPGAAGPRQAAQLATAHLMAVAGISKPATASAQPKITLSSPVGIVNAAETQRVVVRGHRDLEDLTCPAGVGYVDCDNGMDSSDSTGTRTCFEACDNGVSCCHGTKACDKFTGRVCKDGSCYGLQACYEARIGLVENSCKGLLHSDKSDGNHGACLHFGLQSATTSNLHLKNSCIGPEACWRAVRFTGSVNGKIIDSCYGHWSCYGIAQDGTIDGDITNSCISPTPYNLDDYQACYGMAVGPTAYIGEGITNSCHGEDTCHYLAQHGTVQGGLSESCNAGSACRNTVRETGTGISGALINCCNTVSSCGHVRTDDQVPDTCGTPSPTTSPSSSPTAPGPLTLDYVDVKANFTGGASNELEVAFFAGVGHQVTVEVFETCDAGAALVDSSLYEMSSVPKESNETHTKHVIGYTFDKGKMADSTLYEPSSDEFTFCQVTSLVVPGAGAEDLVILQDRRKIVLDFNMEATYNVGVDLEGRTIENETQTISYDDEVEAYKCKGGSGNSFDPQGGALPPNTQLAVCVRIKNNNTGVNIKQLTQMVLDQEGTGGFVAVENGAAKLSMLTEVIYDEARMGALVKTMVPLSIFTFEKDKSLNVSGTIELELVGSSSNRKLRVLAGETDVTGEGLEKAGYDVNVDLQSADDFGPIGSSDGHVIMGKGFAAVGFWVVIAVAGLVL